MKKMSYLSFALSIILFIIYNFSNSFVNKNGILMEYFYLLPIGYLFLSLSFILFIVSKINTKKY